MPGNETNFVGGRMGPSRHNYTFKDALIDHVQDTGLVKGTMHYDRSQAPAPKADGPTPAGAHNGTYPRQTVNGYVNQVFKGKRTKNACVPRKEYKKSAALDNLTDNPSESDTVIGNILVNGARGQVRLPLPTTSDPMAPEHGQSATTKSRRKKKKSLHKKRDNEVAFPENHALPLIATQAQEDWESEIQEVELSKWEEMSFGTQPYGPEDVLNFALRDLTLERSKTPMWTVTPKYFPASHHTRPIKWVRYNFHTEPGQFSDIEE